MKYTYTYKLSQFSINWTRIHIKYSLMLLATFLISGERESIEKVRQKLILVKRVH